MATWREIRGNLALAFGRISIAQLHRQQREEAKNHTPNADMSRGIVHVFASMLPTKEALLQYCFSPVTPHGPEQINLDFPAAALNTDHIEIAQGDDEIRDLLREYFAPRQVGDLLRRIGAARGCVLIPRDAFELTNTSTLRTDFFSDNRSAFETVGTVLHDTEHLRYVGAKQRPFR